MSLSWLQTKNHERADWQALVQNKVAECMIFATMQVGLSSIEEKNLNEWRARMWILTQLDEFGVYEVTDTGAQTKRWFTDEELRAAIGLRTNAINQTRNQWLKSVMGQLNDRANRTVRDLDRERQVKRETRCTDAVCTCDEATGKR